MLTYLCLLLPMKLNQTTMKTLNEKLQIKLDFIRERSKENLKQAALLKDTYKGEGLYDRGLCKGYGQGYALAAEWIQEILDDNNEK